MKLKYSQLAILAILIAGGWAGRFAVARDTTIFPRATISDGSKAFRISKSPLWAAVQVEPRGAFLPTEPSENFFSLARVDVAAIEQCFRGKNCDTQLSFEELRRASEHEANSTSELIVRQLATDFFVSYRLADPNRVRFLDASKRGILAATPNASSIAVDVGNGTVVYAVCPSSVYECDLFARELHGNAARKLVHVTNRVVDLYFRDGVIYALTKAPSSERRFGSAVLERLGHGRYYEDWYLVEISIDSGRSISWPLAAALVNASGQFLNKWDPQ